MRHSALIVFSAIVGCSNTSYTDFELVDVNPDSPSAGERIGPGDHLDHISAWYFGHSS